MDGAIEVHNVAHVGQCLHGLFRRKISIGGIECICTSVIRILGSMKLIHVRIAIDFEAHVENVESFDQECTHSILPITLQQFKARLISCATFVDCQNVDF